MYPCKRGRTSFEMNGSRFLVLNTKCTRTLERDWGMGSIHGEDRFADAGKTIGFRPVGAGKSWGALAPRALPWADGLSTVGAIENRCRDHFVDANKTILCTVNEIGVWVLTHQRCNHPIARGIAPGNPPAEQYKPQWGVTQCVTGLGFAPLGLGNHGVERPQGDAPGYRVWPLWGIWNGDYHASSNSVTFAAMASSSSRASALRTSSSSLRASSCSLKSSSLRSSPLATPT